MLRVFTLSILISFVFISCLRDNYDVEKKIVNGLQQTVEIYRDNWGINHIYAKNQKDLFFAQGYAAEKIVLKFS